MRDDKWEPCARVQMAASASSPGDVDAHRDIPMWKKGEHMGVSSSENKRKKKKKKGDTFQSGKKYEGDTVATLRSGDPSPQF